MYGDTDSVFVRIVPVEGISTQQRQKPCSIKDAIGKNPNPAMRLFFVCAGFLLVS